MRGTRARTSGDAGPGEDWHPGSRGFPITRTLRIHNTGNVRFEASGDAGIAQDPGIAQVVGDEVGDFLFAFWTEKGLGSCAGRRIGAQGASRMGKIPTSNGGDSSVGMFYEY